MTDGRELIDGMSSWWCAIHGYSHPALVRAIREQSERMAHVMFGGLTHEPAVELARLLVRITPEPLDKVFLCDSGSVSVEVALKMALQYQQAVGRPEKHRLLTVRDTGIGLSQAQIDGLFRPFAQGDTDTARKFGGTGLGLAISRKIVEMMGGTIWVESRPGSGSTFCFTVELEPASGSTPASLMQISAGLSERRVLIVDDNETAPAWRWPEISNLVRRLRSSGGRFSRVSEVVWPVAKVSVARASSRSIPAGSRPRAEISTST